MEARNWAVGKKGFSPAPWEVPLVSYIPSLSSFYEALNTAGPVTLDQQGWFFSLLTLQTEIKEVCDFYAIVIIELARCQKLICQTS